MGEGAGEGEGAGDGDGDGDGGGEGDSAWGREGAGDGAIGSAAAGALGSVKSLSERKRIGLLEHVCRQHAAAGTLQLEQIEHA